MTTKERLEATGQAYLRARDAQSAAHKAAEEADRNERLAWRAYEEALCLSLVEEDRQVFPTPPGFTENLNYRGLTTERILISLDRSAGLQRILNPDRSPFERTFTPSKGVGYDEP